MIIKGKYSKWLKVGAIFGIIFFIVFVPLGYIFLYPATYLIFNVLRLESEVAVLFLSLAFWIGVGVLIGLAISKIKSKKS